MINVNRYPILILSSPRTGSTAFGAYIQKLIGNDVHYFLEPDYDGPDHMEHFETYFKDNKKFILKAHLYNLHLYNTNIVEYLTESKEVFKIRIRRRNIIEQISSLYIAMIRKNAWHFRNKESTQFSDTIPKDVMLLIKCIQIIKNSNSLINNTKIQFDQDLFYEDLVDLGDVGFYKSPEPSNYSDILDFVKSNLIHTEY